MGLGRTSPSHFQGKTAFSERQGSTSEAMWWSSILTGMAHVYSKDLKSTGDASHPEMVTTNLALPQPLFPSEDAVVAIAS